MVLASTKRKKLIQYYILQNNITRLFDDMKSPEMFVKTWLQNIKPLMSMDSIQSPTSSEELIATSSTQPSTVELVPSGLSQSSEATHKQNVLQRKKRLK